ncbi:hypothetical protein [Amycolatopsis sp. CA-126428]|uniref:hypothetical protein n=1 Tax=Amycolatopsis sp. CA-126428 TaxID=2073158 RepID=UPI000CD2FE34|nr:hypothetical protein [Amycolatopsis sp. CA-126428]
MPATDETDEITDPDDYLRDNPAFAACRKRHDMPHEDDVALLEAYNDPDATHERRFVCSRCGYVIRKRYHIVLRRGRVVSYVKLHPRAQYPAGYVAKGVRIPRSYVAEMADREVLERQAAIAGPSTRAPRARSSASSTRAGQRRAGRKAVAA